MKSHLLGLTLLCAALSGVAAQESIVPRGEWKSLFDGKSLDDWETGNGKPVAKGWKVEDGTIHRSDGGGSIFSKATYYNFELEFEWKIAKGSNSGLKYRFAEYSGKSVGCEYQVLDDSNHSNGNNPKQTAGSLYDVIAPDESAKKLKQVGEWNQSRIVARDAEIEHWLNGKKILEIDLESDEWVAALEKSKFKGLATFGQKSGPIMLQDHGDPVWFRAIRIKEL